MRYEVDAREDEARVPLVVVVVIIVIVIALIVDAFVALLSLSLMCCNIFTNRESEVGGVVWNRKKGKFRATRATTTFCVDGETHFLKSYCLYTYIQRE